MAEEIKSPGHLTYGSTKRLVIKFLHSWNGKLQTRMFTTIRKYSEEKHKYYCDNIGKVYDVDLNNVTVKKAVLHDVIYDTLGRIDERLLMLDSGTSDYDMAFKVFERFGLKKDDDVLILVFRSMDDEDSIEQKHKGRLEGMMKEIERKLQYGNGDNHKEWLKEELDTLKWTLKRLE